MQRVLGRVSYSYFAMTEILLQSRCGRKLAYAGRRVTRGGGRDQCDCGVEREVVVFWLLYGMEGWEGIHKHARFEYVCCMYCTVT